MSSKNDGGMKASSEETQAQNSQTEGTEKPEGSEGGDAAAQSEGAGSDELVPPNG